ncbi:30S ribosomal protein S9 [Patescibacteria group bacterium]|nr:30S ribosomal protein S9 [Patescibacteria group bacterium]
MPEKKETTKKKKTSQKAKVKVVKKIAKIVKKEKAVEKRYYETVGRRKRAVARVRLFTCQPFEGEDGKIIVNDKPYDKFFSVAELQQTVAAPLRKMKSLNRFEATVKVKGGGIRGQAEAICHGLARALVKFNPDFSKKLKRAGYLRRDPREVERKKPGLKKARRAPQWRKR